MMNGLDAMRQNLCLGEPHQIFRSTPTKRPEQEISSSYSFPVSLKTSGKTQSYKSEA